MPTNDTSKRDGQHTSEQKASEGDRGSPEKASHATIEHYLKGIKYPADKQTLLSHAKDNNAPQDVINVLNKFGDKEYASQVDVSKETSQSEG